MRRAVVVDQGLAPFCGCGIGRRNANDASILLDQVARQGKVVLGLLEEAFGLVHDVGNVGAVEGEKGAC